MSLFSKSAPFYDLQYAGKDYSGEVAFIRERLRDLMPTARSLLDLGCGTGNHSAHFLSAGMDVVGVDGSAEMIREARRKFPEKSGSFIQSRIANLRLDKRFDLITSLFHVLSYQTTDAEVNDFFRTISELLRPEGVAIVDFWHAPALAAQGLFETNRVFDHGQSRVLRRARPLSRSGSVAVVEISYSFEGAASPEEIVEHHSMRAFSEEELAGFARAADLSLLKCSAWPRIDVKPGPSDWSAYVVLRKCP